MPKCFLVLSLSVALVFRLSSNTPGGIYTDSAGDHSLINYADIDTADGNAPANDVSLTMLPVVAVPEPSTWAWVGLSVSGLLLATRRRSQQRVA